MTRQRLGGIASIAEAFVTALTPKDNIDSPASWRAPDGKTWLFATAKEGKGLVLYDGDTGATLRSVSSSSRWRRWRSCSHSACRWK